MVFKYTNKKVIDESEDKLFSLICESTKWPEFIKECKEIKIIEKSGNEYIRYMKSVVNHKQVEMKTLCKIYSEQYKMEFKQLESPWPIKSNKGEWYVHKNADGLSEMVLVHCVEAKYGKFGDFLMKKIIGKHFVENHAEKILNEFNCYVKKGS